jgi:hypothetical protein
MILTTAGVRVRLLSPPPPGPDALLVPPDLEDAYLSIISQPPGSAASEMPQVRR